MKQQIAEFGKNFNYPISRVFQECLTYEGEMDYKTYLDFILALENRKTPQVCVFFQEAGNTLLFSVDQC